MLNRLLSILALLFCLALPSWGQADSTARVSGTVFWTRADIRNPLADTHLTLFYGKDSLQTYSSPRGDFLFQGVPPGQVKIRASHVACKPYEGTTTLVAGPNILLINMENKPQEIAAAYASAEAKPVTHKGDTVIFNAAAVRTMEGDYAVEILRQMPGVEIKDGSIYVNGEKVRRTYVNGILLFGDDPSSALTNILAEEVTTIKAYDEMAIEDRRRGALHGQKEKVLDVRTRNPIVNAVDIQVLAGVGADGATDSGGKVQPRYAAGLTGNFFSEKFLAWADLNFNNVNYSDNRLDERVSWFRPLSGYREATTAGAGVQKYWGDRLLGSNFSAGYSLTKDYSRSFSHGSTSYLALPGSPAREEADTASTSSTALVHNFNASVSLHNDAVKDLMASSYFSISHDCSQSGDYLRRTVLGEAPRLRKEMNSSDLRSFYGGASISWGDNSAGRKFFPSISLKVRGGRSNGSDVTLDTLETSFNRTHFTSSSSDEEFEVSVRAYIDHMPVNNSGYTFKWSGGLNASYQYRDRLRHMFDILDGKAPVPYLLNSYDYTWSYADIDAFGVISFNKADLGMTQTLALSLSRQVDTERLPSSRQPHTYFTVSTQGSLKWRKLQLFARVTPMLPSLEQTRSQVDDRNPLSLLAGNPGLTPSHDADLGVTLNFPKVGKYATISLSGNIANTFRPIVSKVTYFPTDTFLGGLGYNALAGSSLLSWENADYSFSSSVKADYHQRIQALKTTSYIGLSGHYASRPQYVGDILTRVREYRIGFHRLLFGINPAKWLRISLLGTAEYTDSRNDSGQSLARTFRWSAGGSVKATFLKYLRASTQYSYRSNIFLNLPQAPFNTHNLSAGIGTVLLGGRLMVNLDAVDILSRSTSFSVSSDANFIRQQWRPTYGRYFMLSVSYNFNSLSSGRGKGSSFQGLLYKEDRRDNEIAPDRRRIDTRSSFRTQYDR